MKYYFCRLVPPRPTFMQDMTQGEAAIMRADRGFRFEAFPMVRMVKPG